MAGLSSRAIRNRIKSMESTRQITKAMELVASSKLRSAQNKAISSRPYFHALFDAMTEISNSSPTFASPYLRKTEKGKKLFIVIAGDRGLAGGYNNNILKLAMSLMGDDEVAVLPIGKKSVDYFRHRKAELITDFYADADDISIDDCHSIADMVSDGFLHGKFSSVELVYTNFTSMLTQTPSHLKLLPLDITREPGIAHQDIIYESGSTGVFNALVPAYLGGLLYGAMCEATASEQASRRTAMDSATKNADEIISNLNLSYNRARQGAITQEITEIVAGAEQS